MLRKPEFGRIFFEADSGQTGANTGATADTTTSTTATPPETGETDAVTFTDAQQRELNRLIGKARQEGRDAEKTAAQEAATAAAAAAQRDADAAQGNYEAAKASLESERDTARTERDTVTAERDAAYELLETQATALKAELPDELLTGFPEEGSPVERIAWLADKKSVFEVAKQAAGVREAELPRLPRTPGAAGDMKPDIRENLRNAGIRYT